MKKDSSFILDVPARKNKTIYLIVHTDNALTLYFHFILSGFLFCTLVPPVIPSWNPLLPFIFLSLPTL